MSSTRSDAPPVTEVSPEDQPAIVRDLLRPASLGAVAGGEVELRTTHASWVFLCGADVFKLKRPVDLGFLDFRTVEARRRDCEDEVRLNRRLAPGVYLGVRPVRRDAAGRHRVSESDGDGEIVDWAVHMRRLPDEASAAALLAAGRLDRERLAALARTVARNLDEAPAAPRFGEVAALRLNVEENLAQSRALAAPDGMVEPEALETIWRHHDRMLRLRSELFAARVLAGRIREGHGDLRLEHVYFVRAAAGGEQAVVIDCLEFSERLRAGDVAAEIAFLAMELEAAEHPALAAGFVARSAEALDDFDLYGVLDFYVAYRAWVRAKVAGFVARDPQTDHPVRVRKLDEARVYFSLARASGAKPIATPALVAVGGVIGSGKSTLAAALGAELAAPVVGSDRTRKALAGLAPTERGTDDLYTPERKEATYVELLRRAEVVLGSGRTVIVDATFESPSWRRRAAHLARAAGARFAFIEASCPDWNILRERVRARAAQPTISDAVEPLVDRQIAAGQPPRLPAGDDHIRVDTTASPSASVTRALEALRALDITP